MDKLDKDALFCIAQHLDIHSLISFCSCNKKNYNTIYKRNEIWNLRIKKDFPNYKKESLSSPRKAYKLLYLLEQKKIKNQRDKYDFIKNYSTDKIKNYYYTDKTIIIDKNFYSIDKIKNYYYTDKIFYYTYK